jgi:Mg2+/Co2+ transporter CorB
MTAQLIQNIVEITVGVGVLIAGFGYLSTQFKRGRDDASHASNESNDILRGLIDDQKQEIAKLRERYHEMGNKLQLIQLQVDHLTVQRDYLERLIHGALLEYFAKDPAIAKTVRLSIPVSQDGKTVTTIKSMETKETQLI